MLYSLLFLVAAMPGLTRGDMMVAPTLRRRLMYNEVICRPPCAGYAITCVMVHSMAASDLEGEIKPCVRQIWDNDSECAKCVRKQDKKIKLSPSCGYANGEEFIGMHCDRKGEPYCAYGPCTRGRCSSQDFANEDKQNSCSAFPNEAECADSDPDFECTWQGPSAEDTPEPTGSPTRPAEDCSELSDRKACKSFGGCLWEAGKCTVPSGTENTPAPAKTPLGGSEVVISMTTYKTQKACQHLDESYLIGDVVEVKSGIYGHCHNVGGGLGSVKMTCGEANGSIQAEFFKYTNCVGTAEEEPLLKPNLCYESVNDRGRTIFKHSQFTPPVTCVTNAVEEIPVNPGSYCFSDWQAFCEAQKSKKDCSACSGKFKKNRCSIKSKKKIRCKKIKDGTRCEVLGCSSKKSKKGLKCKGSPKFKDDSECK